jgi:hypothetical protein
MNFPDPAQVNLLDERAIVQHIRDMLNFHDLIVGGIEERMREFREKLRDVGWGKEMIYMFEGRASHSTRYEKLIPPPIVR